MERLVPAWQWNAVYDTHFVRDCYGSWNTTVSLIFLLSSTMIDLPTATAQAFRLLCNGICIHSSSADCYFHVLLRVLQATVPCAVGAVFTLPPSPDQAGTDATPIQGTITYCCGSEMCSGSVRTVAALLPAVITALATILLAALVP
eukprot:8526-Heterococcus_DN1.PRE.3